MLKATFIGWEGAAEQHGNYGYRKARFLVEGLGDPREVVAEGEVDAMGTIDQNRPFHSLARVVVCKFPTGARLWPNNLHFWPPAGARTTWGVNYPPVANSNRIFITGWNDPAIDDRYFSRHIGARAR